MNARKVSGSDDLGRQWLVDTGATCHIVSRKFVEGYRIVKEYPGVTCELRAANHQLIPSFGLVDLELSLPGVSDVGRPKGKSTKVVVTRVIVADVSVNVLSPFVLTRHHWGCWFDSEGSLSYLVEKRSKLKVPMQQRERAWFVDVFRSRSRNSPRPSSSSPKSGTQSAPMEVDISKDVVKQSSDHVQSILKQSSCPSSPVVPRPVSEFSSPGTFKAGSLTFLVRGFYHEIHLMSEPETVCDLSCEDESLAPAVGIEVPDDAESDLEDIPLPGLDEPIEEDDPNENPSEDPEEITLGPNHLYDHVAHGHIPFVGSRLSCTRAAGRAPARRLKNRVSRSQVGADFGFFGQSVRFLVVIVLATGMVGCLPMTVDSDRNARGLNNILKEVGMTGRNIELVTDGEATVQALFRSACKLSETPVAGLHFRPTARSQGNGVAERAIGIIKQLVGANVLFLESRLFRRIPLESTLVAHLLRYVARVHNIHWVPQGSSCTALDKLRGRINTQKPHTYPFGCHCVARSVADRRSHQLEKFSKIVYLGPQTSSGGKILGLLAGESRIGLEEKDWLQVKLFQAVKIVAPCLWELSDLDCMLEPSPSIPPEPQDPVSPEKEVDTVPPSTGKGRPKGQNELVVPVSGPPRKWLEAHGLTPGCLACKSPARSRVHNKACKNRYRAWLQDQMNKRQDPEEENSKEEEPKRRRLLEKTPRPPGFVPPDVPMQPPVGADSGSEGSGAGPVVPPRDTPSLSIPMPSRDPSLDPSGDVIMDDPPPPVEPMDVSVLVNCLFDEIEDAFLRGFHVQQFEKVLDKGETIWFQTNLFGRMVWQSVKSREVCEVGGTVLDHESLKKAISLEFDQLSVLKVGNFLSFEEANHKAEANGVRIIPTRWVLVQKPDKVRARLVCKDFRSNGLTSIREDIYSPTSNLESLRLLVSFAQSWNLCIYGADVSTAFLYSPLDSIEIVSLPPSTLGQKGSRLFVQLQKALYGLRRAPLAWYKTLKQALLDMGLQPTSEPTLFRSETLFLLVYVDDILVVGDDHSCKEMIQHLQAKFEVKQTGCLLPGETGTITFLGRNIFREGFGQPLKLGLPSSYYDSIEEALGTSVKLGKGPPNLSKYLKEGQDDEFLDSTNSSRFRSVLGRLAWFRLTIPPMAYYISWLSCFQQKPTVSAEKALIDVMRFAKQFKSCSQSFLHEGAQAWCPSGSNEIRVVVDASWSVRSTMGGIVMFNGTFHKVWSRRIGTVCLSSTESEVHAIAEGCKEGLAFSIIVETLLKGLPKKDQYGVFIHSTSSIPLVCYSDSESALHISAMAGLLRKVRHLELRALLIQQLVNDGRMNMRFVSGENNPSDFLTKCSDGWHLSLLIDLLGLEINEVDEKIELHAHEFSSRFTLSKQNHRKMLEGIEEGLRKFVLPGSQCVEPSSQVDSKKVCKNVRFSEVVSIHEVECETLVAYRAIPRKWQTSLRRFPELEVFRKALSKYCCGYPLFLELCCESNSSLRVLCAKRAIPYIGVDSSLDVRSLAFKELMRIVMSRRNWLCLHISTPCTAGCKFRYIGKNAVATWNARYHEHRQIWKGISVGLSGISIRPQTLISQEWPKNTELWIEKSYVRISRDLGLTFSAQVDRHELDGWFKEWTFRCNNERLAQLLHVKSSRPSTAYDKPDITSSERYSIAVALHILSSFETTMFEQSK